LQKRIERGRRSRFGVVRFAVGADRHKEWGFEFHGTKRVSERNREMDLPPKPSFRRVGSRRKRKRG